MGRAIPGVLGYFGPIAMNGQNGKVWEKRAATGCEGPNAHATGILHGQPHPDRTARKQSLNRHESLKRKRKKNNELPSLALQASIALALQASIAP